MDLNFKHIRKEITQATEIYKNWEYRWWSKILFSKYVLLFPLSMLLLWSYFTEYKEESINIAWITFAILTYTHWKLNWYIDGYWNGITKNSLTNHSEYYKAHKNDRLKH